MSEFWKEIEADFSAKSGKKSIGYWKNKASERLWSAGAHEEARRVDKCGELDEMCCSCCTAVKTVRKYCMKKYCPECALRRGDKLQEVYVRTIDKIKWPLFLTFTIGGGSRWELAAMLMAFRNGISKIRRQRWWKLAVAGGVGSYELKWSSRGWHVHWHAVVDSRWLAVTVREPHPGNSKVTLKRKLKAAQAEVAEQWSMAVGYDPSLIYIRRAKPATARYVVKYSLKPSDFGDESLPILEMLEGMRAAKLVAPWGSVRKIRRIVAAEIQREKAAEKIKCGCGGKWKGSRGNKTLFIEKGDGNIDQCWHVYDHSMHCVRCSSPVPNNGEALIKRGEHFFVEDQD